MPKNFLSLAALLAALCAGFSSPPSRASPPAPSDVTLPSALPSGNPTVDLIRLRFYPAENAGGKAPAVVLLHTLGEKRPGVMRRFARYLAAHGIGAAFMELPYHYHRLPKGERPGRRFTSSNVSAAVQAFRQSESDAETVAAWLQRQPSVDPGKIGVVGISLGAILAHLAMGKSDVFTAGVTFLGGGDLPRLWKRSFITQFTGADARLTPQEKALLRSVDPLSYAGQNRPRHAFMVQAARDVIVPPGEANELWTALGYPPIEWMDANHFALGLAAGQAMRATVAYLRYAWSGQDPDEAFDVGREGRIVPPTIKLGVLAGLDSYLTPAIQWQAITFQKRRDHLSLFHFDLGLSGRGPFAALGLTVNSFLDAGIARRFGGGSGFRPYASLHIVF
jgi:dienelactone hydrolase